MNCQIAETEINLLKFTVLEYDLRTDDGRWYCQLDFDNCVTINTNSMYAGALTSIDMMVKIMDPLFLTIIIHMATYVSRRIKYYALSSRL